MNFMLITNNPEIAKYAEKSGVDRIFIDLEVNGKLERQGHLDTLISKHSMSDILLIKSAIKKAKLLVRLNPLNEKTQSEVDEAIALGADLLMLPMFKTAGELKSFSKIVNGRVGIIPLVETFSALKDIENITEVSGISEIFIGLNDLHLDMGLDFIFEPLADGYIDSASEIIKRSNLLFGFGGVARIGEGEIPAELVLAEHVRLGSNSVILSRSFHKSGTDLSTLRQNIDLESEIKKLGSVIDSLKKRDALMTHTDRNAFVKCVSKFVESKKKNFNYLQENKK